ncbi:MAG: hypothetical protein ACRDLP_15465 [Solirubrobacteraceae bacterium]
MKRSAIVFAAWGAWLGVWTAVQLLFLHAAFPERTIQWVMLGGAAAAALVTGAAIWLLGARRSRHTQTQLITRESSATATVAVGLAILLLGASFGLFLLLIGVGVTLVGLGGIVREGRARGHLSRDRRTP